MNYYYNDNDPRAAAWLRELIAAGYLPHGVVDERSIADVEPKELAGFTQCHFFAGIGGWPLAVRWAGLENMPGLWTGSCPCQPFSVAGKRGGAADERHLWPEFFRLIRSARPSVVFGEQVASSDVIGKIGGKPEKDIVVWLDGIFDDLETANYTCGAAVLAACSVGAPHRRQRLFWVADANGCGFYEHQKCHGQEKRGERCAFGNNAGGCGGIGALEHPDFAGRGEQRIGIAIREKHASAERAGGAFGMADAAAQGRAAGGTAAEDGWPPAESGRCRSLFMGDAPRGGCGVGGDAAQPGSVGHADRAGWERYDIIPCRDGKARRVEAGTFPLADGISGRVGLLRGYGNAIVPQVAEAFLRAWAETKQEEI